MRRSKHVGDDGPLVAQAMECTRAFDKSLDTLLSKLKYTVRDVGNGPRVWVDSRRDDPLAEFGLRWRIRARRVVQRMREVQHLPYEGTVGDALCSPVLGSQTRRQDVVRRRVVLTELQARGYPAHARDGIGHKIHVLESVWSGFIRVLRRIEHTMNAVEVRPQI